MSETSKQSCGLCGRDPAAGWAKIGDVRYCHGDLDTVPTCYMKAQPLLAPWRVEHNQDSESA